jgi:hypothetical protein
LTKKDPEGLFDYTVMGSKLPTNSSVKYWLYMRHEMQAYKSSMQQELWNLGWDPG